MRRTNKMEKNKVMNAFNKASDGYDKYRKQAIPHMDIYYNTVVQLTEKYENPTILDLGAGTGILTQLLHKQHPTSNITLIDLSTEMLKNAKQKFKKQNFKYIEADYLKHEFTEQYDIIVSSLSIHHLTDNEKQLLYKKIYDTLKTNGIFINADQVKGSTEKTEETYKKLDESHLKKQDMPEEEKETLRNRRKLDKPATLMDTLNWYHEIGYRNVEVYYKYYRYFVIAGEK